MIFYGQTLEEFRERGSSELVVYVTIGMVKLNRALSAPAVMSEDTESE
jgi:hypothetical protein